MPTPTKGPRLGGSPAHQRLMLANLAAALFEHKRITTTETKAKRLKPYAERLVTFANLYVAGFASQAAAMAGRAGLDAAQAGQVFTHHGGIGLAVAPLHVRDDALKRVFFVELLAT